MIGIGTHPTLQLGKLGHQWVGDPWLCSGLWLYNAMCNLTAPHEVFIGERREKQSWRRAQEQRPQERATPAHLSLPSRRWGTGTGAILAPSLVLRVPQPFQHPVAAGTFLQLTGWKHL